MLAIGGMTVDELRRRMGVGELNAWKRYAIENGPLNPMLRLDAAVYRAIRPFIKGPDEMLLPWPKEEEHEATLEDVMNILKSAHRRAGKK